MTGWTTSGESGGTRSNTILFALRVLCCPASGGQSWLYVLRGSLAPVNTVDRIAPLTLRFAPVLTQQATPILANASEVRALSVMPSIVNLVLPPALSLLCGVAAAVPQAVTRPNQLLRITLILSAIDLFLDLFAR